MKKLLGSLVCFLILIGCGSIQEQPVATKGGSGSTQFNTGTTVTFHLKNATVKGLETANDIPKENIDVPLPLYPKAETTFHSTSDLYDTQPATPYLKEAKGKYILPVSEQDAEKWYEDTLSQTGYTKSGTGTFGNSTTGASSTGITFVNTKDKNFTVIMSFEGLGTDKTLLQYDVQYIATPARKPGSILPNNLKEVDITYKPRGYLTSHKKEYKKITDTKALSEMRTIINQLSPDTAGVKYCAADSGQGADLMFKTTDNKVFNVKINPACVDVSINQGQTLSDNGLWEYVSDLFNASN
jgi:hypothetical protein